MTNLVVVQNEQVVATSLQIAVSFGKEHRNVLRDIEGLLKNEQTKKYFYKSTYEHPQNKQDYPMYYMNRDGFTLLAMSFTGKKALDFKLKYIEAFNRMEQTLKIGFKQQLLSVEQWNLLGERVAAKHKILMLQGETTDYSLLKAIINEEKELGVDLTDFKELIQPKKSDNYSLIERFINETCIEKRIEAAKLYQEFLDWNKEKNYPKMSNRFFYKVVCSYGFQKKRSTNNRLFLYK